MRRLLFLAVWCGFTNVAFAFVDNPKLWTKGMLFQKNAGSNAYYLYVHPSGQFVWIKDEGYNSLVSVIGTWKRHPLNAGLKFDAELMYKTQFLKYPLRVREKGLFQISNDKKIFDNAGDKALQYLLPQIEAAMSQPQRDYDYYSIRDIGVNDFKFSWDQQTALEKDGFEVIKKLRGAEYNAQSRANTLYSEAHSEISKYAQTAPEAFAMGKKLSKGLTSDSVKLRAFCDWMEVNVKYDAEASELNNKDHSPEFTFINKYGLCLDYARLLNVFCASANIPCINVKGHPLYTTDGKQDPGGDAYHAWNYVKVNGVWLAVDPTWYNKRQGRNDFMIPLSAYQYDHLPDKEFVLANPYGPQTIAELFKCPVVKQYNSDILYLGKYEKVVKVDGKTLDVVLYATKEVQLDLHIDSVETNHHMMTFTMRFGSYVSKEYHREQDKGAKHHTYTLKRGMNVLHIPLVSPLAEYTLMNDEFEMAFWAFPKNKGMEALEKLTDYTDSTWYVSRVYEAFGEWLSGEATNFLDVSEAIQHHPNWELVKQEYHNQPMDYYVTREKGERVAYFEFTKIKVGGNNPKIRVVIDDNGRARTPPKMVLGYNRFEW